MTTLNQFLNVILFMALPYVVAVTFLLVSIYRYRTQPFTYSSLSSQFLENKSHFWALVPFHYGIILVLAGHFLAFFIPRGVLAWNSVPLRLYALEITGLALGVMTIVGLIAGLVRRFTTPQLRMVTSPLDWTLYGLLVTQVLTGIGVAVMYPWGSSWFAATMTPYLWSIVKFSPDTSYVAGLPWLVKAHILNAYVLLWVWPFTRLAHVLVVPNPYLWRRTQVVRWNSVTETKAR
ncbi:MAG: Respiratory nitrate reductase 1 gamma chain [Verrucomicrobiae bacterium]|nr:Respiratory nitrate reductase 1 gamma chain [Verrucomicrobiae bacterium]